MRPASALKWLCALALSSAALWMSAVVFLFSQEDYAPERGSLTYYLGISSLVRGAPLTGLQGAPAYFGSVGDGPKPPQSQVSYETSEPSAAKTWAATGEYLNGRGFSLRAGEAGPSPPVELPAGERVVQAGEFRSTSGELVEVVLSQAAGSQLRKVRISHFE